MYITNIHPKEQNISLTKNDQILRKEYFFQELVQVSLREWGNERYVELKTVIRTFFLAVSKKKVD